MSLPGFGDGEIRAADLRKESAIATEPAGIPGFPGPFEVGRYAAALQEQLRSFARVSIIGEVVNYSDRNGPQVYFELRDGNGALPCAMWRNDLNRCELELRDGMEVVAGGGADFYTGGAKASPRFNFRVTALRRAGEGDLLARLDRLRRQLASEGIFELQKQLRIAALPRTIGVVTAEGSAACRDFLAGLERRGWRGTIVWGHAPVQDRRAAPAITAAIRDLALLEQVETIVVTRGGGSIADLWAFCDESLCRTVALLGTPVISAVGHEVDRTLIDDVSAFCCSTPTHAAEVAVAIDCRAARAQLSRDTRRLSAAGRSAMVTRARRLAAQSRAPREHLARHRRELEQNTRELRAASRRRLDIRSERQMRFAVVVARKVAAALLGGTRARTELASDTAQLDRAATQSAERRRESLARLLAAIDAHDPQRTLERGYALALDPAGEPLPSAAAVEEAGDFDLRMADGTLPARVRDSEPDGS